MADLRDDWTVAEAEAVLPRVRELLSRGRPLLQALAEAEEHLEDLRIVWGDEAARPGCPVHAEWEGYQGRHQALRADLEGVLLGFQALGAEPKDLREGLVDFRGRLADRTVYLCWRDGEPRIRWWHPLEAGFAGRRPLPGQPYKARTEGT